MAIITKTRTFTVIDSNGNPTPGKTVIFYPAGTISNGTTATDNEDGTYTVVINPASSGNVIDRCYDIWWDGTKQISNEEIGYWFFTINISMTSDTYTITYASEEDLPSPIPSATCIGLIPQGDMGIYLYSTSTTQAVIKTTGIGSLIPDAGTPLTVIITIRGG